MPRNPIGQRQFLEGIQHLFQVDGSAVTTSFATTGLTTGKYLATIKKGAAADSNLVTIRLNAPLGRIPDVLFSPITLNCQARLEVADTTNQLIVFRTFQSDHSTKADDCDLSLFVFGTEGIYEGSY
jgi:hypothetical protein